MATSQAILADVDLRYRNSFTIDQKLVWLNEELQELFDILELNSDPYAFTTVEGENFYPFPAGFDLSKIKTVTMQLNNTSPEPLFDEVPFRRNDNDVYATYNQWYTIVSDTMYLYYCGGVPDGMTVYVFCDADPTPVTTATLNVEPGLPTKYQEILKYGILKRIAEARKDAALQVSYDASYQEKITDVLWLKHGNEPEYVQPTTTIPRRRNGNYYPVWNGW